MIDEIWKYREPMKKYLISKYNFDEIDAAKKLNANILIFFCYNKELGCKFTRYEFNLNEMKSILRGEKLERILNEI